MKCSKQFLIFLRSSEIILHLDRRLGASRNFFLCQLRMDTGKTKKNINNQTSPKRKQSCFCAQKQEVKLTSNRNCPSVGWSVCPLKINKRAEQVEEKSPNGYVQIIQERTDTASLSHSKFVIYRAILLAAVPQGSMTHFVFFLPPPRIPLTVPT